MMVEFLAEAEEEMMEAAVFYQEQAEGLGEKFLDDVERATQLLSEQPLIGQQIDNHLRRFLLHRFPFSLIYSSELSGVLIIAVAHQRRRPDYWQERLSR